MNNSCLSKSFYYINNCLVFFIASLSCSLTYSQSDSLINDYRISFVDKIIIKANLDTQLDTYRLDTNNSDLILSTNNQVNLFLSLDYEFIGASIGFSPSFIPANDDNEFKGASSFSDFRFRFFLGKWTQELQYRRNQGFYVENTEDFIPNWVEGQDPFIQFSDFKTSFWQGATSYVLNDNFSLRNVVYNTEWQIKSSGSLVPTFQYGFSRISATIDEVKSFENNLDFQISTDYYYTWVIQRNWFISSFIAPGIGIRFTEDGNESINQTVNNTYFPFSFRGGLQLGYSNQRIIFGANLNIQDTWYNEDNRTTIENDLTYFKVYFGYRFNSPNIIKKPFNWLEKKLGL